MELQAESIELRAQPPELKGVSLEPGERQAMNSVSRLDGVQARDAFGVLLAGSGPHCSMVYHGSVWLGAESALLFFERHQDIPGPAEASGKTALPKGVFVMT
jgi:hypothetical protein